MGVETHRENARSYPQLQPGVWTNVLVDHIADHRIKNPCTWSFIRSKVTPDGEKYVKIAAKCTTCEAILFGTVDKAPEKNQPVKFKFTIRGFNQQMHSEEDRKSVRVGGSKAAELFNSHKKASVLKRELVKASGQGMFEKERGRVVSENAIRSGQYRNRQLNKLSANPIQSLQFLKASNAYSSTIHFLVLEPFSVIYGSPNQYILYNAYKKHNKYTKMTCDATGSIVHKLGKYNFSHIYFVTICFYLNTMECQLISSHACDCEFIHF